MKHTLTLIILVVTTLTCSASENMLENGDFEQRNRSWKFDSGIRVVPSVEKPEQFGTKYLEVRLNREKSLAAKNEFKISPEVTGFDVTMDVKVSADFEWEKESGSLPALQFKAFSGGLIFRGGLKHSEVLRLTQWTNIKFTVKFPADSYDRIISSYITIDRGRGKLWIDNILVVPITE